MKRISVIIPVYNAENNIRHCLDSILPQLTDEDEVILLNDGSTDKSIYVLKEYETNYDIVRVIDKNNEGVANTRNRGIDEATGEYICFIDNDDFVDSDYFAIYYNAITKTDSDLVMGGYRRVSKEGIHFSVKPIQSLWYQLMVVAPWAKIYRRQFLIEENIRFLDYKIGEDNYFNFQVYNKTEKVKVIDYQGYNWWFNEYSISNTSQKGFDKEIDIAYLLDKMYSISGANGIYRYYYIRYVVWYLLFSGRSSDRHLFMEEYKKNFKWLRSKNIKIKFPFISKQMQGEPLKNLIAINIFLLFEKLHLMPLLAYFYCKKKN